MTKQAAIYARVSTNGQKNNYSFATQRADCEGYAAKHGFAIVHIFAESKSGRTLERDGLQKLRTLVRSRAIDAVIVGKLDRLSRNAAQLNLIAEECHQAGVELHYADFGRDEDTPEGRISRYERASIAEQELDLVVNRLRAGRHTKIVGSETTPPRISGHGQDAPYGYRYAGLKAEKTLVVCLEEGRVVVDMFTWFVEGMSVWHIQLKLTEMEIPPPATARIIKSRELIAAHARSVAPDGDPKYRPNPPGTWSRSTIYKILRNPVYRGEFMHYRKKNGSYATDPATWVGVPVQPIVSEEIFAAAQARLTQGRERLRRCHDREYLLRRHIRCECGYACGGHSGNLHVKRGYYECMSRKEKGRKCAHPYTRAGDVDDTVWAWIAATVLGEQHLREWLCRLQESATADRGVLEETREQYTRQRLELEQEAMRLMRLYTAGLYTIEQIAAEKRRIDGSIEAIDAELEELGQRNGSWSGLPQDSDELFALAAEVAYAPAGPTFENKRRLIELLDTRVVLKMVDGRRYVDVTCRLTLDQEVLPVKSSSRQASGSGVEGIVQ